MQADSMIMIKNVLILAFVADTMLFLMNVKFTLYRTKEVIFFMFSFSSLS